MSGWFPVNADDWPVMAEALTKPWPLEAIMMDLRWWQDQERIGKRKRPGRPALRARWGASEWETRSALKAESVWGSPLRFSSGSPVPLQPPSSDSPVVATANADNGPESSSDSPAGLQFPSSDSPHARLQQRTETENKQGASAPPDEASGQASECWDLWRSYRKRARRAPSDTARGLINGRIKDYSVEDVKTVIRWAHDSSHKRAVYLRENDHVKPSTLFRPDNFVAYLEMSDRVNGSPAKPATGLADIVIAYAGRSHPELEAKLGEDYRPVLEHLYREGCSLDALKRLSFGADIKQHEARMRQALEGFQRRGTA